MAYTVRCLCGNQLEVTAGQAGTQVACTCGKTVTVPRLSELRSQAGESAGGASPELAILYTYANDNQPVGADRCLNCDTPTTNRLACSIEYERPWLKGERSFISWLVAFLIFGIYAIIYSLIRRGETVFGEQKVFRLAVTICPSCEKGIRTRRDLRNILCNEPQFDRLFEKYPEAKLSIDPLHEVRELHE
jgi:hypothetical protein